MPRPLRTAPGGLVYHVLNRATGKRRIFEHDRDYLAFERVLTETQERVPMRILAWCVMPNHWHLLLWPREDGDLSTYMRLVTLTHTQRHHAHHASAGTGHLYQGRFKSFVVQDDAHFLTVSRYVEANALRGKLVRRAEDWPEQPLANVAWQAKSIAADPSLANHSTKRLACIRKPARRATRDACSAWLRAARASVWSGELGSGRSREPTGLKCTLRPRGRPPKEGDGTSSSRKGS